MRHSTARQLDPTQQKRPAPGSASKKKASAAARPSRKAALHEEVSRIERDIKELQQDFESRIGPLTRAYSAALRKLEKLDPTPGKKRRPEPRSAFEEA